MVKTRAQIRLEGENLNDVLEQSLLEAAPTHNEPAMAGSDDDDALSNSNAGTGADVHAAGNVNNPTMVTITPGSGPALTQASWDHVKSEFLDKQSLRIVPILTYHEYRRYLRFPSHDYLDVVKNYTQENASGHGRIPLLPGLLNNILLVNRYLHGKKREMKVSRLTDAIITSLSINDFLDFKADSGAPDYLDTPRGANSAGTTLPNQYAATNRH